VDVCRKKRISSHKSACRGRTIDEENPSQIHWFAFEFSGAHKETMLPRSKFAKRNEQKVKLSGGTGSSKVRYQRNKKEGHFLKSGFVFLKGSKNQKEKETRQKKKEKSQRHSRAADRAVFTA